MAGIVAGSTAKSAGKNGHGLPDLHAGTVRMERGEAVRVWAGGHQQLADAPLCEAQSQHTVEAV
jgi:hypothetical protein